MVYTKCLVFLPFCGGCLKCSLLGPEWDVGGEMVTGGKRSSVNPWQKARRSAEPFTVCPPWWQLLTGEHPRGCQQGWPGAAGEHPQARGGGCWGGVLGWGQGVLWAPLGWWNHCTHFTCEITPNHRHSAHLALVEHLWHCSIGDNPWAFECPWALL